MNYKKWDKLFLFLFFLFWQHGFHRKRRMRRKAKPKKGRTANPANRATGLTAVNTQEQKHGRDLCQPTVCEAKTLRTTCVLDNMKEQEEIARRSESNNRTDQAESHPK